MGSCQNYGPFLGTLNNRCRIIIGTQKGTIILTTTHIATNLKVDCGRSQVSSLRSPFSIHLLTSAGQGQIF